VTTALITGITGQDGGYLAEQLLAGGTEVHGLVRAGEQAPEALPVEAVLHPVDLGDDDALRSVLRDSGAREVYNLAGISSVALSWQEPALAAEVNGTLVARLLQLVWEEQERTGEGRRFVQASSAEVFAGTTSCPQDESTPLSPRSPYGASKAFAHHLVQVFRHRGLHASNAILYNHESPRRPGTFVTRKITSTVAAIAEGRTGELVLGNLDARRDWGWAPEYVDALVRMVRHGEPDDYVVATGQSHTVGEFVAAAFARVGIADWERYVSTDPAFLRPVDAVELVGDASRAREVLGWAPQVQFADVVGRMVEADLTAAPPVS
jgi:GDPmannose 4,6-dehydratase